MYGVIYKTENVINGKVYVGQTIKPKKIDENLFPIGQNRTRYIGSGISITRTRKKYGYQMVGDISVDPFITTIIDTAESQEELNKKEMFWIKELNTKCPFGYNIDNGGNSVGSRSEETKKKVSEWRKGRPLLEETKKKIKKSVKIMWKNEEIKEKHRISVAGKNNGFYGKHHNKKVKEKLSKNIKKYYQEHPEAIEHIRKIHTGMKVSEETKRKISEKLKGRVAWNKGKKYKLKNPRNQTGKNNPRALNIDLNLMFSLYEKGMNKKDIAKYMNVSYKVIRNRFNNTKNYK